MAVTIYHNPACGTSRTTLAMIRESGEEPTIIEYLKTPPSRKRLAELIKAMGIAPRDLLRRKGELYDELGLENAKLSDDQLIELMIEHPILINRPIVVTPKGIRLCRPSEAVLDLLENPHFGIFTKEDGEQIDTWRAKGLAEQMNGHDLPNIDFEHMQPVDAQYYAGADDPGHPPRILILYGSLRSRSFSKLLALEAERLLKWHGCETRVFDPSGLPLPDSEEVDHPKVQELRELAAWSEGMVWVSPERHGAMTGIMKAQIDWIPLALGAVRPTQGKTLAVMQVCGGSQSFNTVNQMRVLGRWMRMVTIPNQSSVAKAFLEFDDDDRMKPSAYYNRVVDVIEELVKFTYMVRGRAEPLVDRYSERVESAEELSKRVNQRSI